MSDVVVPIPDPATQKECRCFVCHGVNDLSVSLLDAQGNPLTGAALFAAILKKYSFQIESKWELLTAAGVSAGFEPHNPVWIPMAEALQRTYTAEGVTVPGTTLLSLLNVMIDAYKNYSPPAP